MKTVHTFEHLGKPPYKYAGFAELIFVCPGTGATKAGGSCDHCGTAIRNAFYFTSADGKKFKVGSSCVGKSGDKGLKKYVSKEQQKIKQEKDKADFPKIREALSKLIEDTKPITTTMKHPFYSFASQGKTFHDYVTYCARQIGITKAKTLIRTLTKIQNGTY